MGRCRLTNHFESGLEYNLPGGKVTGLANQGLAAKTLAGEAGIL